MPPNPLKMIPNFAATRSRASPEHSPAPAEAPAPKPEPKTPKSSTKAKTSKMERDKDGSGYVVLPRAPDDPGPGGEDVESNPSATGGGFA